MTRMSVWTLFVLLSAARAAGAAVDNGVETTRLPLQPTRKLEFSVSEGTSLSLTVAPDGRSLVFGLLGDLYRLPITGGKAEPVTTGFAYDSEPRFSPDGKWLAFVSDRDGPDSVWLMPAAGGVPHRLLPVTPNPFNSARFQPTSPEWSPDSRAILASSAEKMHLSLFYLDGRAGVPLEGEINAEQFPQAVFHPNGRYLFSAKGRQIERWDLYTGEHESVTRIERGRTALSPLVSPRGDVLVYLAEEYDLATHAIHALNLNTGEDRRIGWTERKARTDTISSHPPHFDFVPDGRFIVMDRGGRIERIDIATGAVTAIPFTADVSLDAAPLLDARYRFQESPVKARLIQDPQLSPDGKKLVFSALAKLYTMPADGGKPRRLTDDDAWEYKAAWSPDGKWIAYVTWSAEGGHIWKRPAKGGGKAQRLTSRPAFYSNLSFSPDGSRIAVACDSANRRERDMNFEIFDANGDNTKSPVQIAWLPAGGGDLHIIARTMTMTAPTFSADGQRVYFHEAANTGEGARQANLRSAKIDGSQFKTHLVLAHAGEKDAYYDKTFEVSPDEKWVLIRARDQLHVAPLPRTPADGAQLDIRNPAFPVVRLTDIGADYFSWADHGRRIAWTLGATHAARPFSTVDFSAGAQQRETTATPRERAPAVRAVSIDLQFPRNIPQGTVVLKHATILNSVQPDLIEDGDIVVVNNRIAAIGRSGQVQFPPDATQIDVRGKFVVPGFVDTHAHWSTLRRYNVLEPESWDLMTNLAYGVTTSMDVQTSSDDAFAYLDFAETGQALAPRLLTTGPGMVVGGDTLASYLDTLHYMRRYTEYFGTHYIKAYEPGYRRESQWAAMAARELGARLAAHPTLDRPLDGYTGYEHFLPFAPLWPLHEDLVQLFARSGTGVNPTLIAGRIEEYFDAIDLSHDAKYTHFAPPNFIQVTGNELRELHQSTMEPQRKAAAEAAAQIQRAGGLIGVGSHGNWPGIQYHMEMWALGKAMTPTEVLRAATLDSARILGIEQDVGSLEIGKCADLLVLDRNPLQDIRNSNSIRYVMRNGELYEGSTLDQLWPVKKAAPKFWWQTSVPDQATAAR